jgi:uncharacterized membrane protein (Fun14 family)
MIIVKLINILNKIIAAAIIGYTIGYAIYK